MSRLSSRKLSVLVAVAIALSLTAGVQLPHDGECAVLQRIAVDKVSTDGRLWDLSQEEFTGVETEVRFTRSCDSCLSATFPGIRYDFEVRGDTVFRVATETHFIRLTDTIPMLFAVPSSGGIQHRAYASRGRAYHSEYIDAVGDVTLSEIARGTVILPSADTIGDVMLTRHVSRQLIAVEMHRRPVAYRDSAAILLRRHTETLTWRSDAYSLPLAQITTVTDSVGDVSRGEASVSAWICPPLSQPLRGAVNRPASRRYPPSDNGSPSDGLTVVANGNAVTVSGTSPGDCRISIMLTDVLGRVYASMPATDYSRGATIEWSTDGLPPGNYVLYISDSSAPPQAVKLTIKQ